MTVVKKAGILIAFLLAAVLLFVGITYLFLKPVYYRLFYSSDRITGTVSVTVDGKPYNLKAADVTGAYEGTEIEVGFREAADGAKLSIHGGKYGPYTLAFRINGTDLPLEAMIYQYNWYNVSEFELNISIDTAAETVTFSSVAHVLTASATEEHTATAAFSDGPHWFSIVSV